MGRTKKKRHNWKGRRIVETVIDNSETEKIKLDIPSLDEEKYDDSNPVVLPSKKRKTTIKNSDAKAPSAKKLSKKKRRQLEKVLEEKAKKANRAELLKKLAEVQASPDQMSLYLSTARMQTKGLKRVSCETSVAELNGTSIKSVKGSNKKRRMELTATKDVEEEEQVKIVEEDVMEEEESGDVKGVEEEERSMQEVEGTEVTQVGGGESEVVRNEENGTSSGVGKQKVFVTVNRTPEIEEVRSKLPIFVEEQVIMEAIEENSIVILCGETGSGKTTQVPQFLYEAGYASDGQIIGVTEPRRVAAVTMSRRVGEEMGLSEDEVSYQIRYEGNTTEKTRIKFMTDGVMLKEMQNDFLLTKYSAVIVDEAHERSVYTDILVGLLSRIVPLRNKRNTPFKLIIMSATLRIEDFTVNRKLFKTVPPVIRVDARQFPVSIHFNRRTPVADYVTEACRKACKIHRQLPDGGILVFVTGQQEVNVICHKLQRTFPFRNRQNNTTEPKRGQTKGDDEVEGIRGQEEADGGTTDEGDLSTAMHRNTTTKAKDLTVLPTVNLDDYAVVPLDDNDEVQERDDESDVGDLLSDDELEEDPEVAKVRQGNEQPMYVLPLYSLLPAHKQAKVFRPPPPGCRLCVVATNVAETSVTIPNVKYVVDCGKAKLRVYDRVTGVSAFHVSWTSKASANQRAGRAGRTGPGHCYRLYSSAVFNDEFDPFSKPEICRRPVDDVVLQLKAMQISRVVEFPFPTPIEPESIKASETRLSLLGALETPLEEIQRKHHKDEFVPKITALGRAMASFPVSPRYAKMLALSHQHNLLPFVICVVAALTVQEVLMETNAIVQSTDEQSEFKSRRELWMQIRKTWAGTGNALSLGDVTVLLKAVGATEYAGCTPQFCVEHGLRYKAMVEIRKLRIQLTNAVNEVLPSVNLYVDPKMVPPTDLQAKQLRQIILSGLPDCIARKVSEDEIKDNEEKEKWRRAYKAVNLEQPVFVHPNSVLFRELPEYVVYQEIFETTKLYMRGLTAIEPDWLMVFCPNQCTFSKPMEEPAPFYDSTSGVVKCHMSATFGRSGWALPPAELEYPRGLFRIRWFARFLFEGQVCPTLAKFSVHLLLKPATIIKPWSRLQPKTETLLKALISENVDSRETLLQAWKRNKRYLLNEYCEWVSESCHAEIADLWPPVTQRAPPSKK